MRFISGLVLFFYTLVLLAVGSSFIVIALDLVPLETIVGYLNYIHTAANIKLSLGIAGVIVIFISLLVMQITMSKIQKERTIAFENPDGQVLISLTAIEDFVKKVLKDLPEVKELRPNVRAGKKGVTIMTRVTLFSDINIPETTEKIQNIVKSKTQDLLGIEEPVSIKIHVSKIAHREESKVEKKDEKAAPFRGIEYGSD